MPFRTVQQIPLNESIPPKTANNPQRQDRRLQDSFPNDDEEEVFLISFTRELMQQQRTQPTCLFETAGSEVKALIDTGASVNIMEIQQYKCLHPRSTLTPSHTKTFTYGSHSTLPLQGRMSMKVRSNDQ
ncbi:hypothetical protein NDU88_005380 [Pleurodeles waltl]|uniref:Peptidase A2 domain-containing protein n=1 Tax=Pleurodeles waltl TaxID=8319 RepID=A0AAV7TV72_PLEWA|nr:hypothetical protein NDU88_005380 [Pleurodeles waltl]